MRAVAGGRPVFGGAVLSQAPAAEGDRGVTLVTAAAGAAAGAAGAATGAAGGATGGAARGADPKSGDGGKSDPAARDVDDKLADAKARALEVNAHLEHWGDRRALWASAILISLDAPFKSAARRINRFSPLLARILLNGAYFRAIFGLAAIALPLLAIDFGILGVVSVGGLLIPPPLWVLIALTVLGVLDTFAGGVLCVV